MRQFGVLNAPALLLSVSLALTAGLRAGAQTPVPQSGAAGVQIQSQGSKRDPDPSAEKTKTSPSADDLSTRPSPIAQPVGSGSTTPPQSLPPLGRKRIGVALGGGGALALSEIGVLRWFEENHIPVDAIAGTSMGSLVGSLYATGHTPKEMAALTTDQVFGSVFRLDQDFNQINFRRREDARFLPGGFNLGLKRGVSFRNGVLLDYGLNQFLNAQFLPYGADYNFDQLPIPFRCVATDILVGREAVFTRGPLAEAVRASISIPGVFPPLEDGGHIYVDGALTENLPTDLVKREMHADIVLAVSLPLTPPDKGDTNSLLGILQRSFSVASWSNEVRSRGLADVLIEPIAPVGVGAADYAKSVQLADAGYQAAEKVRDKLLAYRLNDADWAEYVAQHRNRVRGPVRNVASLTVLASSQSAVTGVERAARDLPGKPLNPEQVEAVENDVRSDGRYDSVYFLSRPGQQLDMGVTGPANEGRKVPGRELLHPEEKRGPGDEIAARTFGDEANSQTAGAKGEAISNIPVNNTVPVGNRNAAPGKRKAKTAYETVAPSSQTAMVSSTVTPPGYQPQPGDVNLSLLVRDKTYGPPFLLLGGNVIAQTGGTSRATVDAVLTQQDLGGYGSELRARIRFGFLTDLEPEYYRRLTPGGLFVAPRLDFYRAPVYIWANQKRIAERQILNAGGGIDVGYTLSHLAEVRAGWRELTTRWHTQTGGDGLPDFNDRAQLGRVQYRYNGQDRALIPRHGLRADVQFGYQYGSARSADAPRFETVAAYFRDIGHGNTLSFSGEGGSYFNRNVADPYRFTLGGPLRLSASSFEEYRGTDYFLLRPAYFRRIATLPAPLGQSAYVLASYEAGQIRSPNSANITRQDVFFGLAAETPFGAITFGPSIGTDDHRKIVFTLGRFF